MTHDTDLKAFKEMKAASQKTWYNKHKQEQKQQAEDIAKLIDWLKEHNVKVPDDYMKALERVVSLREPKQRNLVALCRLLGDNYKAGDSFTLEEFMRRTYKGKESLNVALKRWRLKGVEFEVTENKENPLLTRYTLKATRT